MPAVDLFVLIGQGEHRLNHQPHVRPDKGREIGDDRVVGGFGPLEDLIEVDAIIPQRPDQPRLNDVVPLQGPGRGI